MRRCAASKQASGCTIDAATLTGRFLGILNRRQGFARRHKRSLRVAITRGRKFGPLPVNPPLALEFFHFLFRLQHGSLPLGPEPGISFCFFVFFVILARRQADEKGARGGHTSGAVLSSSICG